MEWQCGIIPQADMEEENMTDGDTCISIVMRGAAARTPLIFRVITVAESLRTTL